MVKTPNSFKTNISAPIKKPLDIVTRQNTAVTQGFSSPEEIIQALTAIMQRSDPITKEILANTKVSEMEEIGNCINTIISGGKALVAATQKKPSFLSSLFGKVKDNIESVKDQFKTMETKFNEVRSTLDNAAISEKQNISRMKQKLTSLSQNINDLETFVEQAEAYKDNVLIPQIQSLKEGSDTIALSDAQNKLTILEQAIDDAKRYKVMYQQAVVSANESITTSYTAIYTVTVKSKSALNAFSDAAAQYISAKRTGFVNELSSNLTDALENQLQLNAQQTKENAMNAAKNASRSAISIDVLENVSKTLVETMEGVNQIYEEARQKRQAELPRLESVMRGTDEAMKKW